ncbi:hypothetical protein H1C71_041241 [Ictidomys tridecemlineatus]|nr:hypothetical protein H1C71_041241 [Ictidomys tridecemlineatus]
MILIGINELLFTWPINMENTYLSLIFASIQCLLPCKMLDRGPQFPVNCLPEAVLNFLHVALFTDTLLHVRLRFQSQQRTLFTQDKITILCNVSIHVITCIQHFCPILLVRIKSQFPTFERK